MSVPTVTQEQIDAMMAAADAKMKKDGVLLEDQVTQDIDTNYQEDVSQVQEMVQEQQVEEEIEEASDEVEQEEKEVVKPSKQKYGPSQKENSMYEMRKRLEKAEREREEAVQYIMSLNPKKQQQPMPEVQEEDNFGSLQVEDDALVEGKHLKELVKEIKNLRSTVRNYEKQSAKVAHETVEVRLQTQFPDFNRVVTQENLVQLREMNPDLADAILSNKDQYKQAKLAYDMVKQMGIYQDNSSYVEQQVVSKKNMSKPRPLSSIAPTQTDNLMSKVNSFSHAPLTQELKNKYYQEMLESMKGL